ncbi:MAG: NAD(P)-binding domain-containing protein [Nitrososphaerales archaeon]
MIKDIKIAVIGGAGLEGRAIASELAASGYKVYIGSRTLFRAQEAAQKIAKTRGLNEERVIGATNVEAAKAADLVFLTIPYEALKDTLDQLAQHLIDKHIVDVIVPYKLRSPMLLNTRQLDRYRSHFGPGKSPSVTEEIYLYLQEATQRRPHITAALKTLSYKTLALSKNMKEPILTWGYNSEDMQILLSILRQVFPNAELVEVPQMYWRSVEGVCELIRFLTLQGVKIEALNFSYSQSKQ